jgi:hypothetical protein
MKKTKSRKSRDTVPLRGYRMLRMQLKFLHLFLVADIVKVAFVHLPSQLEV